MVPHNIQQMNPRRTEKLTIMSILIRTTSRSDNTIHWPSYRCLHQTYRLRKGLQKRSLSAVRKKGSDPVNLHKMTSHHSRKRFRPQPQKIPRKIYTVLMTDQCVLCQ